MQREAEELRAAPAPMSTKEENSRENAFRMQQKLNGAVRPASVASTVPAAGGQRVQTSAITTSREYECDAPIPIVVHVLAQ